MKKIKQAFAFALAFLLAIPLTVFSGSAVPDTDVTYLYNRVDFEKYTGTTLTSGDFQSLPEVYTLKKENGNTFVTISGTMDNDDKAITLKGSGNTGRSDKLVIEASYRYDRQSASGKGAYICQIRDNATGGWHAVFRIKTDDGSVSVQKPDTKYQFSDYHLTPGVWYHFVSIIDTVNGKLDLFINGTLAVEGVDFGAKNLVIRNNAFYACKTVKGTTTYTDPVNMDFDNAAIYYQPTLTATVNGAKTAVPMGLLDLSREGHTLLVAEVKTSSGTVKTSSTKVPVLENGTVITARYADVEYLGYLDMETNSAIGEVANLDDGSKNAFTIAHEANGNGYIKASWANMVPGSQKAVAKNIPAVTADKGKYVIDISYQLITKDANATYYFTTIDNDVSVGNGGWPNLFRIKGDGNVFFSAENGSEGRCYTMQVGEWTDFRILIDLTNNTKELYINGKLMAEGITFSSKATQTLKTSRFSFVNPAGWKEGQTLELGIDNIAVYYAPEYTVTVNGTAQKVQLGDRITLNSDTVYASVTANNSTMLTTDRSIRIEGDTQITTVTASLDTLTGASVRTGTPTGLRYQTAINRAAMDALLADENIAEIKIGTLIAPTEYVEKAGAFTKSALEVAYTTAPYLAVEASVGNWFETTDSEYIFAGSVANIREDHYNFKFSAVGYMEITMKDGKVVTVYGDYSAADHSRSVAEVAKAALEDPDNGLNEQQLAQIKIFADAYVAPASQN